MVGEFVLANPDSQSHVALGGGAGAAAVSHTSGGGVRVMFERPANLIPEGVMYGSRPQLL